MASDTITIALDGDVLLQTFADAVGLFNSLISGLTAEVSGDVPIDWLIDDLRFSSAVATTRGYAEHISPVERVVRSSEDVFRAIAAGEPVPFPDRVSRPAYELTRLVGGRVLALRLYTPEYEALIQNPAVARGPVLYQQAFGVVEGVVESLFRRSRRFTMVDRVSRRPVSVHLDPGAEETMRGAWGNEAAVEGWVTREARTGRPIMVDRVRSVQVLSELEPGGFRRAKGALPRDPDEPRAEQIIRMLRDAN